MWAAGEVPGSEGKSQKKLRSSLPVNGGKRFTRNLQQKSDVPCRDGVFWRFALQTRTAARAHIAVALPCPNGLRRQTAVTGGSTSSDLAALGHLPQRGRLDFNCPSVLQPSPMGKVDRRSRDGRGPRSFPAFPFGGRRPSELYERQVAFAQQMTEEVVPLVKGGLPARTIERAWLTAMWAAGEVPGSTGKPPKRLRPSFP